MVQRTERTTMIVYEGCITSEIRANFLKMLYSLEGCECYSKQEVLKHCGVAIELLDNAQRYGNNSRIRFEWNTTPAGMEIKLINTASKEDAENMLAMIDRIRSMNPEDVKRELLERLANGNFGEKGGAGLGLLQIISRAGNNLDAKIERTDNENYLCESTFKTALAG